uniref:Gustatory receptor n=1 Tax=Timema poppense TaxID=170557 RepID=A0A7R9D3H9_TIMPO|nr:unnamed protein product [Timema poppensis]
MRARPKRKRNPSPFFVRPAWDHHCTEVPMKSRGVSDPPEALFQDFKPVLVFCAILGIFPLQLRRTGDAHFKWFSRSMLYSGVFYTLVGCFDLWLARRRLYDIVYNTHNFNTTIFKYNFFVYLVPHLILFPTHWLEGRKLAAFRNKWWEFQTSFFRVTGRSLSFGLRKTSWLVVVILPLFSVLYIGVVEVMTNEFTTAELFFYWYMLTLLVLHLVVWYMSPADVDKGVHDAVPYSVVGMGRSVVIADNRTIRLELASARLKNLSASPRIRLSKDGRPDMVRRTRFGMRGGAPRIKRSETLLAVIDGSGDVSNYRVLWLQLSELTKMTGSSNTYVQGQLLLEYFATILLSLYSIMIGMFENRISSITLSQGLNGIFWSLVVLVMCNSAGWAQWQVGPVFIGRLSELLHYGRAVDQFETFLEEVSCNQPIIILQGYITLDHGLSVYSIVCSQLETFLQVASCNQPIISLQGISPWTTVSSTRSIGVFYCMFSAGDLPASGIFWRPSCKRYLVTTLDHGLSVYSIVCSQLETFLQVASCNQPMISLQGYVNLDRSLFTTVYMGLFILFYRNCSVDGLNPELASTVVTYLVVLLQFGSKDREDDNVDKYNFTTTSSQL